ncbi:MAG: RiPP maturation radical SAM C-methyltransferase [Candidatus Eremiobacteraeota bacterium]|nr:RiPP maturation radical SAM C-methyltransferase [Candidatus Eremiobacteraeota bacterium]
MIFLVQMPYAAIERPSIGLGLIHSELSQAGIACRTLYPNLDWFSRIGLESHQAILATLTEDLVGEWTFARAAFGEKTPGEEAYLEEVLSRVALSREQLLAVRAAAESFVEALADQIVAQKPRVVGCSSCFQQNCASLALLRRIKEKDPTILTLMGGANCEGTMGVTLMRNFEWLDYIVSGDADKLIAGLIRSLLAGRPEIAYGVFSRDPKTWTGVRSNFTAMDQTAVPHFDDYFEALEESGLDLLPGLVMETSRGCWWGQKHHCTFCGLNGSGMGYRSKSKERVLEEIEQLSTRYGIERFFVVDNILDHAHLKSIMPVLAGRSQPFQLFYETKSNLKKEQLQLLSRAGVRWIQPGIESLHDEVLSLMDKGSTGLMNVQLLRNARELGMVVYWNFLVCFPNEQDSWYAEMSEWTPWLSHLQPAPGMAKIRFDRFSPYHTNPQRYNIEMQPASAYGQVYPVAADQLPDLAYFFHDTPEQSQRDDRYLPLPGRRSLYLQLKQWVALWQNGKPPVLSMHDDGQQLVVRDSRPVATAAEHRLSGRAREILLEARTPGRYPHDDANVAELVSRRLLLKNGERYLSLPTDGDPTPYPDPWLQPGGSLRRPEHVPRYTSRARATHS